MEQVITRSYRTDEIIIVWRPSLCTHVGVCWKTLPEVFRPRERPWVRPEFATTQQLTDMIDRCPSGALSYRKL